MTQLDISVAIPIYNEKESLPELISAIHRSLQGTGLNYEILCIDDDLTIGNAHVVYLDGECVRGSVRSGA